LLNYNQELEVQVAKRVQELDQLNKDLDSKIKIELANRQKQEAILIHQSRLAAMGEMIGAIAHQWRQPLNALSLVHQNVYLRYKTGQLNADFMNENREKSDRLIRKMSSTIDDFRSFFKPNNIVEIFNINDTLFSTLELLEAQFKYHHISMHIFCDQNIYIKGLQGEFSQVILNLINNAKDIFLERKQAQPEISIHVEKSPNGLMVLMVSDNGGGMQDDVMDKIFEPYFTTKKDGNGAGIGLYMSKMIIENHMGGKLYAYNTPIGANFVIELQTYNADRKP
jgi:two-component system, NtrC family, sensor kinase